MQLPERLWLRISVAKISRDWVERGVTAADHRDSYRFGRNGRRQMQFLAGRALARRMLEDVGGQGETWTFVQKATGRPHIEDKAQRPGPDLSISHTGDWVACALTGTGRIGVDLEQGRPGRRLKDISTSFLTEAEAKVVDIEGEAAFLGFWTLREALAKAEGSGLTGALILDGSRLMPALGKQHVAILGESSWTLGHRSRERLHLAVAWNADHRSEAMLALVDGELTKAFSKIGG